LGGDKARVGLDGRLIQRRLGANFRQISSRMMLMTIREEWLCLTGRQKAKVRNDTCNVQKQDGLSNLACVVENSLLTVVESAGTVLLCW